MDGQDILFLQRELGLTQEDVKLAAGYQNRGTIVDIQYNRCKLSQEEYARVASAMRDLAASKEKREGVMA